jgi:hypothetical protein
MTSAITTAERERQKRVQADHCERVTRALIDAGPAGMTISLIRCRTAVRSPAEIMARLVRSQKAFSRPDDGGAKGALRWFASAELRDAWKPDFVLHLGDAIDARIGSASFPNQIVNNVSGTVRPIMFSVRTGANTVAANSSATVTFPANRFTQAPEIIVGFDSTSTTLSGPASGTTSSVTAGNVYNSSNASRRVVWMAFQTTSAASLG